MSGFVWGFLINPFEVYDRLKANPQQVKAGKLISNIKFAIIELNDEEKYQKKLEQEYENISKYVFHYFWWSFTEVPSIQIIKSLIKQNIDKNFYELLENEIDSSFLSPHLAAHIPIILRSNKAIKQAIKHLNKTEKNNLIKSLVSKYYYDLEMPNAKTIYNDVIELIKKDSK